MKMDHDRTDNLRKYLNEDLSMAERRQLEDELARNEALRRELEKVRQDLLKEKSYRDELPYYLNQKRNRGKAFFNFKLLALIIVVAAASFYLIIELTQDNYQAMFQEYFELPADRITQNGAASDIILKNAMNFYRDNQFDQATDLFMQFLAKRPDYVPAMFYLGVSRLAMGNTIQSEKDFKKIIKRENAANYKDMASWYLALNYLKQENPQAASETLKSISENSSHQYLDEARILLEDIE